MALLFKTKGGRTRSSDFIVVSHQCDNVEDKEVYFGVPLLLRDTIIFSKVQILPDIIPGWWCVVVSKQEDTQK